MVNIQSATAEIRGGKKIEPAAGVPAVTLPIYENARLGRKVNFARGKIHGSNEAKTRNQLKFAEVPQTGKSISALSGPKFTLL